MKTLKKTLCLVLAVVMVVGALVLPASAAYKDDTSIGTAYKDAVTTLESWKVMEGDANGNFKPTGKIQRQEMAAIVYRLLTGDNAGYGKDNSAIYASYAAKFTDVDAKGWAAGYIGYCANKGIIVGTNEAQTTFEPTREIPGNDVLCMLLRALGYGKNKEYQGADWSKHIYDDATRLHLTDGITTDLKLVSERQQVAQMTWKAATAARVTWSEAEKDYIPYKTPNQPDTAANIPLVRATDSVTTDTKEDVWGNPTGNVTTKYIEFTYPVPSVKQAIGTSGGYPVLAEFFGAITECELADLLKVDGKHWVTTRTNGKGNDDVNSYYTYSNVAYAHEDKGAYQIDALDTTEMIGHEGRWSRVYLNPAFTGTTESAANPKYLIVGIDTFLGVVTGTHEATYDTAGHVVKKAYADVAVVYNQASVDNQYSATSPFAMEYEYPTTDRFAVGDKLALYITTATGTDTQAHRNIMNGTTYTNLTTGGKGAKIQEAKKITGVEVTVKGILRDTVNGTAKHNYAVGFTGTNGTTYYYNYTFGKDPLNNKNIGQTYIVWTDAYGNVLDYQLSSISTGYGVTLSAVAKQYSLNGFALTYTVLLPDGTQTTIDVLKDKEGTAFTSGEITGTSIVAMNTLVHFLSSSVKGYYFFDQGNLITTDCSVVESGRANAIGINYNTKNAVIGDSTTPRINGTLVNNETVFFVANYAPNVVTDDPNDYVFTGYTIYNGFQTIPDLERELNSTTPTSSTGSKRLVIQAFDVNPVTGEPLVPANNRWGYAKYVLVLDATKQTNPPAKINTVKYAYITSNNTVVEENAGYYEFPAVIDGQKTTLKVALNEGAKVNSIGLYTYSEFVNGEGHTGVYKLNGTDNSALAAPFNMNFMIDADNYGYADGVLTRYYNDVEADNIPGPAPNDSDIYYTVAADCAVWIVNPTNGKVAQSSLSALSLYAKTSNIWFQLNELGRVNLIYIEESNL